MSNNKALRIGVIWGGMSSEREISLESGRHIYQNLDPQKYIGIPLFLDKEGNIWKIPLKLVVQNTTEDICNLLECNGELVPYEKLKEIIDFVFIGLHGKYGEDGCLQGLLELQKIPYNGSGVLSSAIGMDKFLQRKLLSAYGINIPNFVAIKKHDLGEGIQVLITKIQTQLGDFPWVVKPAREGCSVALTVVKNKDELMPALHDAGKHDITILVEELIKGRELTCGIIGNYDELTPLPPTENPPKGDFLTIEEKFLPGMGENITPPNMPEEILNKVKDVVIKVYQVLKFNVYARIDLFVTEDERIIVTEPNSLPGMTPSTAIFQQAAELDMTPMMFIDKIIQLSLQAHRDKIGPL